MTSPTHPYPAYRPSGVQWFGHFPEHWDVPALKRRLARNDSGAWSEIVDEHGSVILRSTEQTKEGGWRIDSPARRLLPNAEHERTLLNEGDLLVTKSSGSSAHIGKTSLITREIAALGYCFSNFMQRLHLDDQVLPKFAWWHLNSNVGKEQLNLSSTTTTGLNNLSGTTIGNFKLPLPPLPEQQAIVRYLDHVDGRIRRLVDAKRRLISLLEEERQAVINQAVTRGLDPNLPLKPSGVDWIGDIPAHWEAKQLGRIGRFSKGSGGTKEDEVGSGVPCVRYGDLYTSHKYHVRRTRTFISNKQASAYTQIQFGDILFAGSGETLEEIGKSAVNLIQGEARCGGDVIILRPSLQMDAAFSGFLVDSRQAQLQKSAMGRGFTVMHIYSSELKYLWVALPPINEQTAIVAHIEEATGEIDSAIGKTRRQIELLEEYRTRLIADVVTGKLDVRKAAALLPEELAD